MKNIKQFKTSLSREAWLDAAMKVLLELGIGSVSISRLATILNITRGSFYHHFSGREDLLRAMLGHWEETMTVSVREVVKALKLPPQESLLALIRAIRKRKAAAYDAPFRAWGLHDPLCRATLERVDTIRLEYIKSQFEAAGFSGLDAINRAQLLLFYEMSASAFFVEREPELSEKLIEHRLDLLLQPCNQSLTNPITHP